MHLPDMRAGYVALVDHVRETGIPVYVRGLPTVEVIGATVEFGHNTHLTPMLPVGVNRGINTTLAAVEALSLVAGVVHPDLVTLAAPSYVDVLVNPNDMVSSAYGPRVHTQLGHVYQELRSTPTSRRAVVSIWNKTDLVRDGDDRPCTLTLQFLLRDQYLHMIVNMRSQDVWLGAGTDMFVFSQLHATMALALGAARGRYVHHVGSLHLYERDRTRAEALHLPTPRLTVLPSSVARPVDQRSWYYYADLARDTLTRVLVDRDSLPVDLHPWYVEKMTRLREALRSGDKT